ncbi:MAG: hypothetical protein AAF417_16230 [Pseudomonadota bacterium]
MGEDIVRSDAEPSGLMPDIYSRATRAQKKTTAVTASDGGKFDPYNSGGWSKPKALPAVRKVAGEKPAAGFDPYNSA